MTRRNSMSCFIHKDIESKSKCPICQNELCESCEKFCDEYGACPKCLNSQVVSMLENTNRGIIYSIFSLICSSLFLILYLVDLLRGTMQKNFIIIGAILVSIILPVSIILLVHTIKKKKEYKSFLNENKIEK